jgi:hypothetical protein
MSLLDTASLIVTPNAYKEGKLYSVIPSDGSGDMSVVRATTATRVNSAGLVELVPYNLLQYSEDFANAYWEKGNIVTIVQNTTETLSPTGTNNVAKITTNGTGFLFTRANVYGGTLSETSQSLFVKKANNRYVGLRNSGATAQHDVFDFDTETWTNNSGATLSFDKLSNGWYRLKSSRNNSSLNYYYSIIVPNDTSGDEASTVSNLSVYVWGAQAVESSTAKDYLKTETRLNIPRLDYSNGTCPSLLVEPQRTNLALYSSSFTNAAWAKNATSVTANAAISPSGIQDAQLITSAATNDEHLVYYFDGSNLNQVLTISVFVKKLNYKYAILRSVTGGVYKISAFDLDNGTIASQDLGPSTIEDMGNGWYRISATFTSNPSTFGITFGFSPTTSHIYTGDGTSGNYAWGFQTEAGSYATSYIPTTSASVTRNADVISKTGISSLIGQTEGTIFWEGQIDGCQNLAANIINSEKNTNTSFTISYIKTNLKMQGSVFASGVEYNLQGGSVNIGETAKLAYAYKSGDSALYVNGVQVASSSNTFTFPSSFDDIFIGDPATYFAYQEGISTKAAAIWKTRLTNDQLEALTGTGFNTYAEMAEYYNYVLQ